MELNREQIEKALECCVSGYCYRDGCPLCEHGGEDDIKECTTELAKNALSLIKKLTEENEQWRADWEKNQRQWDEAYEKLEAENAEQDEAIIRALKEMGEIRRETKADTVMKMQERFNEKVAKLLISPSIQYQASAFIDEIAKEMLEGSE